MNVTILLCVFGLVITAVILNIVRSKNSKAQRKHRKEMSSYQIALDEVKLGAVDAALWAKSYAHSDSEDASQRSYVRQRAQALDEDKQLRLRKLGIFGWLTVVSFYSLLWAMQLGELITIYEAKGFNTLLPNEQSTFILAFILISVRVLVFLYIHKIISGYSFGNWPVSTKRRPKSFVAIWVGLSSTFLVNALGNLGHYMYISNSPSSKESLGFVMINIATFLMWCILGLVIAYFYKLKVR